MAFTWAGHYGPFTFDNVAGSPLPSTPVSVYLVGTTTLASLYTSRTKATAAANPTATDSRGNVSFFADPGDYDLLCNGTTLTVSVPVDPSDAGTRVALANGANLVNNQDMTLIGTGGWPNPVGDTITGLMVSTAIPNPNKPYMGALGGFTYYTGTEQAGAGTHQGGSMEAYVALSGSVTQAVLGFEGIAFARSSGSYVSVIGSQATVGVLDTATVTSLVAMQVRGPLAASGTPTVTTAISLNIQEPTVGTTKYSIKSVGRHRFIKGTPDNAFEVSNASDVLQWASDGNLLTGYASDGASARLIFNPSDAPAYARILSYVGSTPRHLAFLNASGTPTFEVAASGSLNIVDVPISFGTTTGTKIGTSTSQKLAFYNATPIVQGASVADATDAASAITQLNALISRIEALGLIATV